MLSRLLGPIAETAACRAEFEDRDIKTTHREAPVVEALTPWEQFGTMLESIVAAHRARLAYAIYLGHFPAIQAVGPGEPLDDDGSDYLDGVLAVLVQR